MVFKVCSFSGGGVRGIIPATITEEMLKISTENGGTGKITDLCDYVVGTSVGGIIAAGLVVSEDGQDPKYTSQEISDVLAKNAKQIFKKHECKESLIVNIATNTDGNFIKSVNSYQYGLMAVGLTVGALISGVPLSIAYLFGTKIALASVVVGASVGGAIASQIKDIKDNPGRFCTVRDFFAPKYGREGLDEVLNSYFGNLGLTNTVVPFTTFSFSLSDGSVKSFSTFKAHKSRLDNYSFVDALGATSAVPTFFPHKIIKGKNGKVDHEVDSGLYTNSPISSAMAVLMKHAPDEVKERIEIEGISVLSIGTGYHIHKNMHQNITNEGILDWLPLITRTAMEGAEYAAIIEGKYIHNSSRVDIELEHDIPMDSSDVQTISDLQEMARDRAKEQDVRDYVKCVMTQADHCQLGGILTFESEFHGMYKISNRGIIMDMAAKNIKATNSRLSEHWKQDNTVYEDQTLDQKLSADAKKYDNSKKIHGKSIDEILEKAQKISSLDHEHQDPEHNNIDIGLSGDSHSSHD